MECFLVVNHVQGCLEYVELVIQTWLLEVIVATTSNRNPLKTYNNNNVNNNNNNTFLLSL